MDIPLDYRPEPPRYRPIPSGLIARWLGEEEASHISQKMVRWQGPPVALANVPGMAYACAGGDFAGKILCGYEASLHQLLLDQAKVEYRKKIGRIAHLRGQMGGFSSLSDLISEATTGGKKQVLPFQKAGIAAPAANASQDMWRLGALPAAGATASTANAGTVYTNADTGTLKQVNAGAGDTLHFINGFFASNVAQASSLMLCDKLFAVNRNYNSSLDQAITGVPTRYQTATTAPGNFQFTNVTTALGATASNVTLTYVDQDGNAAEVGPSQVVRISSAVDTNPLTQPLWFYFLNDGDTGLRNLTNFKLSAAMGAGAADRGIYHPIAIIPGINLAATVTFIDGINTAFNFERVYDGAALEFIEWFKSATAAANDSGQIVLCSG